MAVTTTRNLPAQFVEDLGVDLAKQVVAQSGVPVVATGLAGISQQPGESAADFAARQDAARAFTTRQQSLAGLAPTVEGLTTREQRARTLADAGIGSFQPFLTSAQQLTGAGAGTGTGTVADFMSPYQQQVIDTSLAEFDRQAKAQEQRIRDQAVQSGAFGGGREGVQLAEFGAASDRNRAALQAGLLQQGFGQAVARRDQAFRDQLGLAQLLPQLQRADIAQQGALGGIDRSLAQAQADATREAARQATFLPQEQLDRFASQVTGIMGGYPAQFATTNVPNPTPIQTALGIGSTLAGIYTGFNPPVQRFQNVT
tara:strand:- start:13 stop:954 length:942 start_codon:yes stop_codon:yes gene_type:complete